MQHVLSLKSIRSKIVCLLVAAAVFCITSLTNVHQAYAGSLVSSSMYSGYVAAAAVAKQADVLTQLKAEVLPQLYEILTPEQEALFEDAISGGITFRKAFKNLMLTPEQKRELKTVLNSVPKKDLFASLTPMQKKELFLSKKDAFMPSSEEIIERINKGMPAGESVSGEVQAKIETGIKKRDEFRPSSETIMKKVEAGLESAKESLGE